MCELRANIEEERERGGRRAYCNLVVNNTVLHEAGKDLTRERECELRANREE